MTEESEVIESPPAQVELGRVSFPAIARGLVFAVLAIGVVVGIHAYIGARLIAGLQLTGTAAELGWGLVWGLFLTVFAALFARRLPRETAQYLRWVAYGWMGLFALLLVSVAAVDLSSAVSAMAWGRPLAGRWGGLEVAAVGAMALPAFAWGIVRALGPARIERLRVPIAGLPSELEGYRIVQISDLHIGETLGSGWARRVAESVNSLDPDAVAVTGDVADGSPRRVGQDFAPLGAIRAKDGVFFVTGNHEYYSGLSSWLSALQRMGWRVLANEHQVIHRGGARLVIAGVNDHDSQDSSPAQALEGAPAGAPRVLLAHQPRSAFQAGGLGVDLQLSGHTHGGQFFPWKYFVRLQQPVLAGLAVVGGVRVYTHRGTGYWGPPLRLGAPPEIAVLELVCEQLVDDA